MKNEEAEQLAETHWIWLETLLHKVYVDAMVHGIKHGQEAKDANTPREQPDNPNSEGD